MTFLNPEHFRVVAGQDVVDRMRKSREAMAPASGLAGKGYENTYGPGLGIPSESLCAQQRMEAAAGILGAEICSSLYGYSVRYDSGLQNFAILAGSRNGQLNGSYEAARQWAEDWQAQDPTRRYVFTRVHEGELINYGKRMKEWG